MQYLLLYGVIYYCIHLCKEIIQVTLMLCTLTPNTRQIMHFKDYAFVRLHLQDCFYVTPRHRFFNSAAGNVFAL